MSQAERREAIGAHTYSFLENLLTANDEKLKDVMKELADVKYALDQSSIIAITDQRGTILYANDQFCTISKYASEELLGQDHRILNSGYHSYDFFKTMWATIGSGAVWRGEVRNQAKDGSFYWVDTTIVPFMNEMGTPYQYISIRNDITTRKQMEEELRQNEEKYRLITENSSDLISVIHADGSFAYCSPSHKDLLGYDPTDMQSRHMLNWIHEKDRKKVADCFRNILASGQSVSPLEYRIRAMSGEYYYVETTINPINAQNAGHVQRLVLITRDITERKKSDQAIYHLAYHDTLTDLPNRRLFVDQLRKETTKAKRNEARMAVLFLDLDRFKNINDSLGHEMGDLILIETAKRLRQCVRPDDIVARFAGDEFIILLTDLASASEAEAISEQIQLSMQAPYQLGTQSQHISCSLGIAMYPSDGRNPDELLKRADMALYAVKERGRKGYSFFHHEMEERSLERSLLENELQKAIHLEQFHLDYQPKVDLTTGQLTGMEALVRWIHPELGRIAPGKFIPIAEETGLIIPLGEWVLRKGCAQNKAWQDQGYPPLKLSVNLSARQFYQTDLLDNIKQILNETGLDPKWLELEVTESIFADIDDAAVILQKIRDLGVDTSIDDFGTGYSSFSYIKHLPIDTLKIDASFIRDIHQNKESHAIVRAILSLAQTLNLNVIAEGVESKEQVAVLSEGGCHQAQGYLFSKPVSSENFEKMLQNRP
ncbi:EAL domain-containing protein [Paenibacillus allorhizosphaerae]|uniref:EAL domain-containing protein n=1 Tax=Paenibacillus allorhizosphaerae TaxID=2849866 RepID=A0ABM8VK23_9BACL|nr:bifunctional diguanylate cyclase/phosphodiesterase [Paenibacillus allorhizosphaerae]CAG7646346.1 hypothetical protein PAECIP111802_03722 [Paenibacillus allorhizosphaerae]